MLTSQRRRHIMERVRRDGHVIAKEISREWSLSEDTIRRDLRELAEEGLLQRVHGGALLASPATVNFPGRQKLATNEKARLGRAAAQMIRPGQVAILDGGTTTLQIARHLPPDLKATVVTHSPTIAVELAEHGAVEVVLLGGRLYKHSVVAMGAATIEAIKQIRADLFFIGVTGIHPVAGLSTGDLEEAHIKRALSDCAAETVVLASAEKLNAASSFVIAPVTEVSELVVLHETPEEATSAFVELGITVTRV
ncbi:MAG TPA: DeoR/GlpR family DNA-binding transcription regulator [Bryobacteraceae bacterium]